MAYFISRSGPNKTLYIYHKDVEIIEHTYITGRDIKIIHKIGSSGSPYAAMFLTTYEHVPILEIKKEGRRYTIEEFILMDMVNHSLTKTALKKLLKRRGMNKKQIDAVFEDMKLL